MPPRRPVPREHVVEDDWQTAAAMVLCARRPKFRRPCGFAALRPLTVERAVVAALRTRSRWSRPRRCGRGPHQHAVGVFGRAQAVGDDDARAVAQQPRSACSTAPSVAGSRLDVASSRMSTGGSATNARAIEMSCFWPALSREPRKLTIVSYPSGSDTMNRRCRAFGRRPRTSASVASGPPEEDVLADGAANRKPSCGTIVDVAPESCRRTLRRSWPSSVTGPRVGRRSAS